MTTVEDVQKVKKILMQMGTLAPPNPNELYKTKCFLEFTVDGIAIDVMAGFAITRDGMNYDCSLRPSSITSFTEVNGVPIPLQSLTEWRRYYELMGRAEKVQMIDR